MSDAPNAGRSWPADLVIGRFDALRHDAAGFDCGKADLNAYIQHGVLEDERDRTTACYVLASRAETNSTRPVLGYFTLNSFALSKRQARRRDRDRSLGRYDPVPAVLIGRLALDVSMQRQGLGSVLLAEAIGRVLEMSQAIGAAVVVVHAIDDDAAAFYEHQGFTRFRDEPNHLSYPLATFAAAIASLDQPRDDATPGRP